MIKARPVAGDLALGAAFLDAIRPFVWRRHLDFAAIADIAGLKRRIDRHKRPDAPDLLAAPGPAGDDVALLLGHDLKLGQGGIREVEFLAQTLQLVWGGRNPGLREPRTLPALRLLAEAGHVAPAVAEVLDEAYRVLRGAEHRAGLDEMYRWHEPRLRHRPQRVRRERPAAGAQLDPRGIARPGTQGEIGCPQADQLAEYLADLGRGREVTGGAERIAGGVIMGVAQRHILGERDRPAARDQATQPRVQTVFGKIRRRCHSLRSALRARAAPWR